MRSTGLQMGADPELFLQAKGNIVPSEKYFLPNIHGVHCDNAAVEFNTTPSHCLQTLATNIGYRLIEINRGIKGRLSSRILLSPAADLLESDLGKYPTLREFGCSPSMVFSDDKLEVSVPKVSPLETTIRSIGYHLHFGSGMAQDQNIHLRLVQMCDLFVGIPGVLMEKNLTEAVLKRRQALGYGKAGEFRRQPHGFEYRTLGPWPLSSPEWCWWAHSAGRDAYRMVDNDLDKDFVKKFDMRYVAETINTNNFREAVVIWNKICTLLNTSNPFFDFWNKYGNYEATSPLERVISSAVLHPRLRGMFNYIIRNDLDWFRKFRLRRWMTLMNGFLTGFPKGLARKLEYTSDAEIVRTNDTIK